MRMKRMKAVGMLCLFVLWISSGFTTPESEGHRVNGSGALGIVKRLKVSNTPEPKYYVSTLNTVWRFDPTEKEFSPVFSPPNNGNLINDIYVSSRDVFAATTEGLYLVSMDGRPPSRIFNRLSPLERNCLSVIDAEGDVFLGTGRGLFRKFKDASNFTKLDVAGLSGPVYSIVRDQKTLYLTSENSVWRLDLGSKNAKKIASVESFAVNSEESSEDAENDNANNLPTRKIFALAATRDDPPILVMASTRGLEYSLDKGESWAQLSANNAPIKDVTSIIISNHRDGNDYRTQEVSALFNKLYLGTYKGLYRYSNGNWQKLYKGFESDVINDLLLAGRDEVWAATNRGVVELSGEDSEKKEALSQTNAQNCSSELIAAVDYDHLKSNFNFEPTIREVQGWAIQYAEVSPEKISQWRRAAKNKAWLPTFSAGLDEDRNKTISDSIYGTTSSGGSYFQGPDDKSFYSNMGWGISLSWDLGEVIWNNDQTSIDSRSKLMVELRDDILDQVTRIYFERRRMQYQVLLSACAEPKAGIDDQLRIEELAAVLDSYTGGKFSRSLNEWTKERRWPR